MTMSVSAAPQARPWAPTYGDDAFAKIWAGIAVLAPLNMSGFAVVTVRMVNSSGAVSPRPAMASRAPLTIPPSAVYSTTVVVTRAWWHRRRSRFAQRVRHQPPL
jgi:hypothetical protein